MNLNNKFSIGWVIVPIFIFVVIIAIVTNPNDNHEANEITSGEEQEEEVSDTNLEINQRIVKKLNASNEAELYENAVAIKDTNNDGKYITTTSYKIPSYKITEDAAALAQWHIRDVKKYDVDDNVDKYISKYIVDFYDMTTNEKKFTVEYINNDEKTIESTTATNILNGETATILASENDAYIERRNKREKHIEDIEAGYNYFIDYNEIGNYGKIMEYEGQNEIFYYFPSGTYIIEVTNMSESTCWLWVDENIGYSTNYGTSYNLVEKLTFTSTNLTNTVSLNDNVHIYNSNKCSYKLKKLS